MSTLAVIAGLVVVLVAGFAGSAAGHRHEEPQAPRTSIELVTKIER